MRSSSNAVLAFLVTCTLTSPARGDDPSSEANTLFTRGKAELAAGRVAEACASFEKSLALDEGTGTEIALALCYERQGRMALALSTFEGLERRIGSSGRADRVAFVRQRRQALAATVPRLAFRLGARPPTRVLVDGKPVSTAGGVYVDPGVHSVLAELDARVYAHQLVTVEADGRETTVVIPSAPDGRSASPPPSPSQGPSRAPGWAFLGGAVASSVVAATAAGLTFATASEARGACPGGLCSRVEDLELESRGQREAWVANIGVSVAVVCTALALYFFLRTGKSASVAARPGVLSF